MQITKLALSLVAVAATGAVASPVNGAPNMVRIAHAGVPNMVRIAHAAASTVVRIGHDEVPTVAASVVRIGHDGGSSSSDSDSSDSANTSSSPPSSSPTSSSTPPSTPSSTSSSSSSTPSTSSATSSSSSTPAGVIGDPTNISHNGTSTQFVDGSTTVVSSTLDSESHSKSAAPAALRAVGFTSLVSLVVAGGASVLLAAF
ncbi:hypothetical protein IWW38_000553 [Coemansia aciculifera]|uniref:Uncharacterized protein n=1 Tax=Coemansia aciculifera TaxID=417176 RepID=A0ACC1MA00_9FUNG|nr:hypothetical protein IWW38_000553 [Coemansia aciculifera]